MFMESLMTGKEFVDYIFLSSDLDVNPIECAVYKCHPLMVKYLFDMKEIQARYKNNGPLIFRLCFWLFVMNSNTDLTDYVLSALKISKEKLVQMLSYKCPQQPAYQRGATAYHVFTIIGRVVRWGSFGHLQRLIAVIGKQAFIDNMFNLNGYDEDAMYQAIDKKNMKIIEYILSIDEIKKKYLSDNDLLFRLVSNINQVIESRDIVQHIVDSLGLTEAKLSELTSFQQIDVKKIIPFTK